jgi:hypothetical protein
MGGDVWNRQQRSRLCSFGKLSRLTAISGELSLGFRESFDEQVSSSFD